MGRRYQATLTKRRSGRQTMVQRGSLKSSASQSPANRHHRADKGLTPRLVLPPPLGYIVIWGKLCVSDCDWAGRR